MNVFNFTEDDSLCKVKNNVVVTYFVMLIKENPGVVGKNCC